MALSASMLVNAQQTEQWVQISPDLSTANPSYVSMEFDSDGNAYYAYSNQNANSSLNVQKFDGLTWSAVGPADFTSGAFIRSKSIAFDTLDVPYIAFTDGTNNLSVIKFNGSDWDTVGTANFGSTNGTIFRISMDIDKITNQPVVAYRDNSSDKLSIQTFDGTNWGYYNFGQDISIGSASLIDIYAGEHFGLIYVAYADAAKGDSAVSRWTNYTAMNWYYDSNDTIASNGPVLNIEIDAADVYPAIGYINSNDNKVYYNRLSGAGWDEYAEAIGTADFYTDIAIVRTNWIPSNSSSAAYFAFSDTDEIYDPTTKKVTDGNFNTVVANTDNIDVPGFTSGSPSNVTFGFDQNDSLYLAMGHLTAKVFVLRAISQAGIQTNDATDFTIYPNPATNQFSIHTNELESGSRLNILNLAGQVVLTQVIQNKNQTIDVSELTKGTYMIQLNSEKLQTVKKLVVQ